MQKVIAARVVFFLSPLVLYTLLYNQGLRAETSAKEDRNIKLEEEANKNEK